MASQLLRRLLDLSVVYFNNESKSSIVLKELGRLSLLPWKFLDLMMCPVPSSSWQKMKTDRSGFSSISSALTHLSTGTCGHYRLRQPPLVAVPLLLTALSTQVVVPFVV